MKKLAAVLVFVCAGIACFAQQQMGTTASEISLPGSKENTLSLSSLQGKVVLIDFWASWCRPCRQSFPGLKTVYNKFKPKGFEIYGISLDTDLTDWKQAIASDKINWLHVIDTTGEVALKWDVNYIPNSFLLDRKGRIVAVNPSHETLDKLVPGLLKQE